MAEQIFISYSIKNRDVADAVCSSLEGTGRKCWIAPRNVLPGSDWSEAIIDAIGQSRLMVLIHSDSANRSVQIKRETERAVSKGVTILPFRIEDVPVSKSLEYYLSTAYWVDAVSLPLEPHLQYLSEVVSKLTETTAADGRAAGSGRCAACGAEKAAGATTCGACGSKRAVAPAAEVAFQEINRRGKWQRWRLPLPRSRAAKIMAGAICAIALFLSGYLWRGFDRRGGEARFNQAQTYASRGEYDRAIEELTEALKEDPSYAFGYRARGVAYFTRGRMRTFSDDFLRASADLKKATELNPRDDYAFYMLGQTHGWLGELDSALAAYSRGLELQPQNSDLLKARGYTLIQLKEYDRAIKVLAEARKLYPKDPMILAFMGSAQIERGEYREAAERLTDAIELNPSNPQLYKQRSEAYQKLGRLKEAIHDDQQATGLGSGQRGSFQQ